MTVTGNEMWAFRGASGTGLMIMFLLVFIITETKLLSFMKQALLKNPISHVSMHIRNYNTALNTKWAWEKLPFDATAWNVGNHFSTTNKEFTAPVAGMYLMNWMFQD